MDKIAELKQQIREEELRLLKEKESIMMNDAKSIVGKCYKHIVNTGRYSKRQQVNTDYAVFLKVLGVCDTQWEKGKIKMDVHSVTVHCTPVGWMRGPDGTGLKYQMDKNYANMSKKNRKVCDDMISVGTKDIYPYCNFISKDEKGNVSFGEDGYYIEIPEEEMMWVEDNLADLSKKFYERFAPLFVNLRYPITPETEGIISSFDEATLKAINEFVKNNPSMDLDKFITIAKRESKESYFNGVELPELIQYSVHGDKALHLEICSGDAGTDYEPYVTHYYIKNIYIDWKAVLYPIRLKLSCGVLELSEKLESIQSVYDVSSWICSYDDSSCDAYFNYAKLKDHPLAEVNEIIKKHVKK